MLVIKDSDSFPEIMVMRTLSGLVTRASLVDDSVRRLPPSHGPLLTFLQVIPFWIDTSKPRILSGGTALLLAMA